MLLSAVYPAHPSGRKRVPLTVSCAGLLRADSSQYIGAAVLDSTQAAESADAEPWNRRTGYCGASAPRASRSTCRA